MITTIDPASMPERCYTLLKSLNEFDAKEIREVIRGVLGKTNRDNCFIGNYIRGKANVESLISLNKVKHFQAIAMLARSMFELAVDVKLIDIIQNAVQKISVFSDVEKLRAARKIVQFKTANSSSNLDTSVYASFIAHEALRIESEMNALWPGAKKLPHWSGMDLSSRVARLKAPFDELYATEYPKLSWYVHSGLTGVANLQAHSFEMLAGSANRLAAECYMVLLTSVIDEFGIVKADTKIKKKLDYARYCPFADGPGEIRALELELLG